MEIWIILTIAGVGVFWILTTRAEKKQQERHKEQETRDIKQLMSGGSFNIGVFENHKNFESDFKGLLYTIAKDLISDFVKSGYKIKSIDIRQGKHGNYGEITFDSGYIKFSNHEKDYGWWLIPIENKASNAFKGEPADHNSELIKYADSGTSCLVIHAPYGKSQSKDQARAFIDVIREY